MSGVIREAVSSRTGRMAEPEGCGLIVTLPLLSEHRPMADG